MFLISIDTLRSDHLSVYGAHAQTPAFDAFAKDAVLFERAYSHCPLTLPSHTTILSGRLPAQHGVRDNTGYPVDAKTPLLQTILASHGYTTGAAVSAYVLRRATGIDRGFASYDDDVWSADASPLLSKALGAVQRRGEDTLAVAERWLASSPSRPFYFLHFYEPHAPYEHGGYSGEVTASDTLLGRFLDDLKSRDLYDRALIVVLSDHGEGLGDHGEDEHGIFLYREAIQVPLLIKLPGNERHGTRVATPVGLVDVMPTILDVLGIPSEGADGRALFAKDVAPRPVYSETWYPRLHFGWSDLHSLVDGDEHFIDAPRPELYDLRSDPRETKNVLEERRRRYVALRDAIAPLKRAASAPAAVSAEDAAKLAALGYIGSSTQTDGPLADPKDKTGVFRELQAAFRLYREGKDVEALAAFETLLKTEPHMTDLWDMRAKVLFRMGRADEAIEAGKEALRRSPTSGGLAVDLANQLLLAGRLDEARAHAELAVKSDPSRAHEVLARIALLQNDLAGAEREAKAAGENDAARYTLARVAQRKGDYAEVERLTAPLVTRNLAGLHALRGDALARLGREDEAAREFREELRVAPTSPEANRGLIVLLVTQGKTDEATQVVRAFANAAPNRETYRVIAETLQVVGDEEGARYWKSRAH